jgi:Xaa-Pro aminopeptidase
MAERSIRKEEHDLMKVTEEALKRAADFLAKKGLDGILVTSRENNRYFSGFSGSDSTLLICSDKVGRFLFTDSRYTEQAQQECPSWKIVEYKKVTDAVGKKVKELKIRTLAFESRHLSYNMYHRYIEAMHGVTLVPQEKAIDLLRVVKQKEELEAIRSACSIAEKAFEKCLSELKPGVRECDFAIMLEYEIRRGGSGPLPFEIIVASGARGAMPHGVASDKPIRKGEMVTIDFGANFKGYMADTTMTVAVGNPSDEMKEIYEVVKNAHDGAIEEMRAGMTLQQVDAVARRYIEKKGFGKFFGHGLGHGVGLAVHEEPLLSPLADGELPEGAVVTVEPGIYIPGKGGVRIESLVHITKVGHFP